MSERPDFSLVVGTLGRTDCLQRLWSTLKRQSGCTMEVILIDQSDGKLDLSRLPELPWPLHRYCQGPGLSRCRNTGLKSASGRVIAFPDDDCYYPNDLLPQLLAEFDCHPEIDALSVKVTDENGRFSAGGFMSSSSLDMTPQNVWRTAVSPSLFFRREAMAGFTFDERLGVGASTPYQSGEETDFCLQLLAAGKKMRYCPGYTVFHPVFCGPFSTARGYGYGMGMGAVLKKHHCGWSRALLFAAYQLARCLQHLCRGRWERAKFHLVMAAGRLCGYRRWPR